MAVSDGSPTRMPPPFPVEDGGGPPWILRAIYFIFVGLWLTAVTIHLAWILNVTIIGLPLGLWLLDRVPQILTLKPMRHQTRAVPNADGSVRLVRTGVPQRSWLLRAIYFLLIGWWLSLLWLEAAFFLTAIIIGIPIAILMFNASPAVTTLRRT